MPYVLVDVAEPELRVLSLHVCDMFPVGRDGHLGVDLIGAASGESIGRDDELSGVRRDSFGRSAKREYPGEHEGSGSRSKGGRQDDRSRGRAPGESGCRGRRRSQQIFQFDPCVTDIAQAPVQVFAQTAFQQRAQGGRGRRG